MKPGRRVWGTPDFAIFEAVVLEGHRSASYEPHSCATTSPAYVVEDEACLLKL